MPCRKKIPPKRQDYWAEYYQRNKEKKNARAKVRYHERKAENEQRLLEKYG